MKTFYVPVSGLSRKAKNWYVPVDGLSRKAIKAYCSENGLSRQFWESTRQQGVLKPSVSWAQGSTLELDTCTAMAGLLGALNLGEKLVKPYFIRYGVLSYWERLKDAVLNEFASAPSTTNAVYVDIQSGTSSSDEPLLYFIVRYAALDNLQRTVSSVTTYTHFGNTYASLTEDVRMTDYFYMSLNLATGEVTKTGSGSDSTTYSWIGVQIDGTLGSTVRLRMTNLGMTMQNVSNDYDWYWDFGSGDSPLVDKVDGFVANESNTTQAFDGIVIDKASSRIQLPSFVFQTGRTIEIFFGEFDRHYDEYTSPSYYKYYEECELASVWSSNVSQYSTHKVASIVFNGWQDNQQSENPYPKSHGVGLSGSIGNTYENYMGVNGLKDKSIQIKLPDTGGWQAQWYQFMYADSGNDSYFLNVNTNYFRIGYSGATSYDKAAYTFKVKAVAVY